VFKRDHIRSLTVYFGYGEERPFFVEKNPALLMSRLRHNVTFFYLNYMILTGILFCLTIITSPVTVVGVGLLGLLWMWFIRASSTGTLIVGGESVRLLAGLRVCLFKVLSISNLLLLVVSAIQIPQKPASLGMGIFSAVFLFWLFQSVFWWTMFSGGFLISVHAFLRDSSMHKDLDDAVPMEGDLHLGEDDSFIGNQV
jgi:hypothetical protein